MSNRTPADQPRLTVAVKPPRPTDGALPKSPAEALEPTRGPARPRGRKQRREARRLSPTLRALNGFFTICAKLLAVGAGAVMWFESEVNRAGPLAAAKSIVVREREGSRDIAQRLEDEGVIASHHVFIAHYVGRSLSTWFGGKPLQLKAGEYQFGPGQSVREVADEIGKGRSVLFSVTVPEGLTSWQIVERLKADQGLTGEVGAVPLEGTLLPDTYKVPRGMARSAVLELMQTEARKFLEKAWEGRQPDLPLKSLDEALALASIVEKETGRRDERERVAAVFVNRLRQGMRLQSDPTILYGLSLGQTQWGKPISRADINSRTAHNTYQIAALPPTPICNPGRATILATLAPSATKDLYFVADGNGGHVFSETLKDHNAAVSNWRKTEKDIRAQQQARAAGQQPAGKGTGAAAAELQEAEPDPAEAAQPAAPAAATKTAKGRAPVAATPDAVPPLPVRKPKAAAATK